MMQPAGRYDFLESAKKEGSQSFPISYGGVSKERRDACCRLTWPIWVLRQMLLCVSLRVTIDRSSGVQPYIDLGVRAFVTSTMSSI